MAHTLNHVQNLHKQKVLFIYRTHLLDESPENPGDFRWGMEWLDRKLYEVSSINVPRRQRRSGYRLLFWPPDWFFAKALRIGFPIEIYPMFRQKLGSVDHIVCVNDQISLAILWWRMLGQLKGTKIHCVVMSLPERVKSPHVPEFVKAFLVRLLGYASTVLTLSKTVHQEFEEVFGVDRSKLYPIYFGIDSGFWSPSDHGVGNFEPYALAIGNDLNRDYETLIRALPPGIPLKLVTQQKVDLKGLEVAQNIEKYGEWVSNLEVRELYRNATLVIIPVKPVLSESTGLSTILQAMACGAPVITADGRTIRELFEFSGACAFYKAGDRGDLAAQIRRLWENGPERKRLAGIAEKLVDEEFTSESLSGRISEALSS